MPVLRSLGVLPVLVASAGPVRISVTRVNDDDRDSRHLLYNLQAYTAKHGYRFVADVVYNYYAMAAVDQRFIDHAHEIVVVATEVDANDVLDDTMNDIIRGNDD